MSGNEERGWLASQGSSLIGIGIDFTTKNLINSNLKKVSCTRIRNAWQEGTIIDKKTGEVWVRLDKLASILCTADKTARFIFGGADTKDKKTITIDKDGELKTIECLSVAQVSKELIKIIMNPSGMIQHARGNFSNEHLTAILQSPEMFKIITMHLEYVDSKIGNLKKSRIKRFNLTADELTGELFDTSSQNVHFSHIRGKRTFVRLAADIHNGLVVNNKTHDIISYAKVEDEHQLLKICKMYRWDTSWYKPYVQRFKD